MLSGTWLCSFSNHACCGGPHANCLVKVVKLEGGMTVDDVKEWFEEQKQAMKAEATTAKE